MKSANTALLPKLQNILERVGENIKLARLRRKFSAEQVAARAGITRTTLWHIEKGGPQVAMGSYAQVLFVLGMAEDFLKLATDDELGHRLRDADLVLKKRAPKKK